VRILVTFSEAMNPTSVDSHIVLTANGTAVPATVMEMPGSTDHLTFQLDVTNPHNLATPLTVIVQAASMAWSGVPLIPKSWDSPTDVSGDFQWAPPLSGPLDALTVDTSWDFTPVVN
jgi:hypothetical protein